jgi:hypothetical protein
MWLLWCRPFAAAHNCGPTPLATYARPLHRYARCALSRTAVPEHTSSPFTPTRSFSCCSPESTPFRSTPTRLQPRLSEEQTQANLEAVVEALLLESRSGRKGFIQRMHLSSTQGAGYQIGASEIERFVKLANEAFVQRQ